MSEKQQSLFGEPKSLREIWAEEQAEASKPAPAPPKKPPEDPEQARLNNQCQLILARLRQGPATNDELAKISRKYTSRISDLRKMGHPVFLSSLDRATGLSTYILMEVNPCGG